jgi:hypothetical protein
MRTGEAAEQVVTSAWRVGAAHATAMVMWHGLLFCYPHLGPGPLRVCCPRHSLRRSTSTRAKPCVWLRTAARHATRAYGIDKATAAGNVSWPSCMISDQSGLDGRASQTCLLPAAYAVVWLPAHQLLSSTPQLLHVATAGD